MAIGGNPYWPYPAPAPEEMIEQRDSGGNGAWRAGYEHALAGRPQDQWWLDIPECSGNYRCGYLRGSWQKPAGGSTSP